MSDTPTHYCCEHSREVGEQLFGTAPRVDAAILLEVNGRWEPDVLDGDQLPAPVRARLVDFKEAQPNRRVIFIRRGNEYPQEEITCSVALLRERNPALYTFQLNTYGDFLALDLPAILAEDPAYQSQRQTDPVLLVCTHGRRDRSCARFGRPAYDTLARIAGDSVWQASHVGGHRLAANVVALPHGVYYGHADLWADRAVKTVEAIRTGRVILSAYRGRSCYPKPVQAADYFLRRETGSLALDAFRFVDAAQSGADEWTIRFAERESNTVHQLQLAAEESDFASYMNSEDTTPETVTQYRLIDHR